MPILQWHDRVYATGISIIDQQHRELVAMINAAHDRGWVLGDEAALVAVVADMVRYAAEHFATEARLMAAHDYPHAANHHQAHRQFTDRATAYQQANAAGNPPAAEEVFRFLAEWLSAHILEVDTGLAGFLRERGVA